MRLCLQGGGFALASGFAQRLSAVNLSNEIFLGPRFEQGRSAWVGVPTACVYVPISLPSNGGRGARPSQSPDALEMV